MPRAKGLRFCFVSSFGLRTAHLVYWQAVCWAKCQSTNCSGRYKDKLKASQQLEPEEQTGKRRKEERGN